jgi:hypothetical protein
MNVNEISSSPYFNVAGIAVVGGLTLATVVPNNTWLGGQLANHALLVMLFFLVSGFIGFIWRNNAIILFNFMACIVVCSFLKEHQPSNQQALYAVPLEQPTVRVANLTMQKNSDLPLLQQYLEQDEVDFLSLQVAPNIDFPTTALDQLKSQLPYCRIIDNENQTRTLVFSSYEMESLDTFRYQGNQSISFVGTLYMHESEAVPFISTNIPAEDYERPEAQQHWAQLSQYMSNRSKKTINPTAKQAHLTALRPAVKALRHAKNLSHSSEYRPKFPQSEHLFYAENLICKQVEDLLGCGAVATYQFVGQERNSTALRGQLRGGASL